MSAAAAMDHSAKRPPLDLEHHFSSVTMRRAPSMMKEYYKYFQIPGIGNLAGGMSFRPNLSASGFCILIFNSTPLLPGLFLFLSLYGGPVVVTPTPVTSATTRGGLAAHASLPHRIAGDAVIHAVIHALFDVLPAPTL
ncbi:hypothetical protein LY76DRAFT_587935 [Colletotrichum caudatum]|nr:hypothetical protein LY76DRAFT_587935 [Colletotrichum caudatum]